jgi:hypothetical protein
MNLSILLNKFRKKKTKTRLTPQQFFEDAINKYYHGNDHRLVKVNDNIILTDRVWSYWKWHVEVPIKEQIDLLDLQELKKIIESDSKQLFETRIIKYNIRFQSLEKLHIWDPYKVLSFFYLYYPRIPKDSWEDIILVNKFYNYLYATQNRSVWEPIVRAVIKEKEKRIKKIISKFKSS